MHYGHEGLTSPIDDPEDQVIFKSGRSLLGGKSD